MNWKMTSLFVALPVIACIAFLDVWEILPGYLDGSIRVPRSSQLYILGTMILSGCILIGSIVLLFRVRKTSTDSKFVSIVSIAITALFMVAFDIIVLGLEAPLTEDAIIIVIAGILAWLFKGASYDDNPFARHY